MPKPQPPKRKELRRKTPAKPTGRRFASAADMMADTERKSAAHVLRFTPAADVTVDEGFNQRTDWGDMDALTLQIAEKGVIQPAFCRTGADGRPHLVAGERRLKGLLNAIALGFLAADEPKAQFPWLPSPEADADCHELNLLSNSGKPFTYSETARTYAAIVTGKPGFTTEAVANRTRLVSAAHIRNYLDFLAIVAEEIHACVDRGECTATLALDLARAVPDKAEQWDIYLDGWKHAGGEDAEGRGTKGEGEEGAPPAIRVTAKHLSVPTGKSPGRYGKPSLNGSHAGVPFQDVNTAGGTDHEGRMHTHEKVAVEFPKLCWAKGAVLIARVEGPWTKDEGAHSQPPTFRTGIEAKWPAVRKEDGRMREFPRLNGKAHATREDALLAGMMELRGEIEAKDFNGTKKTTGAARRALAVQHLTALIDTHTGNTGAQPVHEVHPGGTGGEDPDPVTPDANRTAATDTAGQPPFHDEDGDEEEPAPKPYAPPGGWPAFVNQTLEDLFAELGPKVDLDYHSAMTITVHACLGKHPDRDKLKATLRNLISK